MANSPKLLSLRQDIGSNSGTECLFVVVDVVVVVDGFLKMDHVDNWLQMKAIQTIRLENQNKIIVAGC